MKIHIFPCLEDKWNIFLIGVQNFKMAAAGIKYIDKIFK